MLAVVAAALPLGGAEWYAKQRWERDQARLLDEHLAAAARPANPERLTLYDLVRLSPVPGLVYELRPGVKGRYMRASYCANSLGMRGPEVTPEKPPDTFRIALIGDSYAFGWGLEEPETFGRVLERALQGVVPGKRVELLNFGVPGYNTAMEAALLEHRALAYQPDLVLLEFYFNDVYIPHILSIRPAPPTSYLAWLIAHAILDRRDGPAAAAAGAVDAGAPGLFVGQGAVMEDDVPPELRYMVGKENCVGHLRRMRDVAKKAKVPLVVAVLSVPEIATLGAAISDEFFGAQEQWFADAAREMGLPVVNLLHPLADHVRMRKLSPLDLVLSPTDPHLNSAGSEVVARVLLKYLRERDLLMPK